MSRVTRRQLLSRGAKGAAALALLSQGELLTACGKRETPIHFLGDLHVGGISQRRLDRVASDIANPQVPTPRIRVQIGDMVENGVASEDEKAKGWMNSLPSVPWYTALGNHDLGPGRRDARTLAEYLSAYGLSSQNYVLDLDSIHLIFVGPDSMAPGKMVLSPATLSWLADRLAAATRDCFIISHAPLAHSVLGKTSEVFSSTERFFHAHPDADIRRILRSRPKAKVWIAGHTHSPPEAPGLIRTMRLGGGRSIVSINCSALYYTGRRIESDDPLTSLYMTYTGSGLELSFRDHAAGAWKEIHGSRVTKIDIPA